MWIWKKKFLLCRMKDLGMKDILMVSCQKGPTRHAYAWQIGPFWQDTLILEMSLEHHGVKNYHGKLVLVITHHPVKLGPPNVNQRCQIAWLQSLLFGCIWPWPFRSNWTFKSKFAPIELVYTITHIYWSRHERVFWLIFLLLLSLYFQWANLIWNLLSVFALNKL